jgi:hypothetical protein
MKNSKEQQMIDMMNMLKEEMEGNEEDVEIIADEIKDLLDGKKVGVCIRALSECLAEIVCDTSTSPEMAAAGVALSVSYMSATIADYDESQFNGEGSALQ